MCEIASRQVVYNLSLVDNEILLIDSSGFSINEVREYLTFVERVKKGFLRYNGSSVALSVYSDSFSCTMILGGLLELYLYLPSYISPQFH